MKNAIVITNVDSLLGYALAYRFWKIGIEKKLGMMN